MAKKNLSPWRNLPKVDIMAVQHDLVLTAVNQRFERGLDGGASRLTDVKQMNAGFAPVGETSQSASGGHTKRDHIESGCAQPAGLSLIQWVRVLGPARVPVAVPTPQRWQKTDKRPKRGAMRHAGGAPSDNSPAAPRVAISTGPPRLDPAVGPQRQGRLAHVVAYPPLASGCTLPTDALLRAERNICCACRRHPSASGRPVFALARSGPDQAGPQAERTQQEVLVRAQCQVRRGARRQASPGQGLREVQDERERDRVQDGGDSRAGGHESVACAVRLLPEHARVRNRRSSAHGSAGSAGTGSGRLHPGIPGWLGSRARDADSARRRSETAGRRIETSC